MGEVQMAGTAREVGEGGGEGAEAAVLDKVEAGVEAHEVAVGVGRHRGGQALEELPAQAGG